MSLRIRASASVILVSCALTAVLLATSSARAGAPIVVKVRVSRTARGIPNSFLGLSMEINEFSRYEAEGPVFDRLLSLIRSGRQPVNLRLGGRSADETLWNIPVKNRPRWLFDPGPRWLAGLTRLVRREDLRVTLDLNLWSESPSMAARFAHAALRSLGSSRLTGVAIGNEPNLYRPAHFSAWQQLVQQLAHGHPTNLINYSPGSYRRDYLAYARALARSVPHLPLLGPEMTTPALAWFSPLAHLHRFKPRFLTVHRYPLSNCYPKSSFMYPRLSSMLSDEASSGLARSLGPAITLGRRSGASLWLSEMNSASCGGMTGVTNAFASALWAPDALMALIKAGVAGVNWHVRPEMLNSPFHLHGRTIIPMPELYGLALFSRLAGPGARLAKVRSPASRPAALRVWAVSSSQGVGVLAINKGGRAMEVEIAGAGAATDASVERLTGPSIRARRGIRLDGQWIGPDARWHGSAAAESLPAHDGSYDLMVPAYSAALVHVPASGSGAPPAA